MISVVAEETELSNSGTRTLGDLLYGNNEKFRVPEQDWVALIRSIAAGDQVALHSLYEDTSNRFHIDRADNQESRNL